MNFSPIGSFWVRQSILATVAELTTAYDVVFTVLSWESRCLAALPYLVGRGQKVMVLHFKSQAIELEAVKLKNLDTMKTALAEDFGGVLAINSSLDHRENFQRLHAFLSEETVRRKRPLAILADMTCLAKRYLLYVLGLCFQAEFAVILDYLYTEGVYSENPSGSELDEFKSVVSMGDWAMLQVPYFEGREFTADRDHDLFISVGLEMHAVMEYIERNEPRNIQLLGLTGGDKRVQRELLEGSQSKIDAVLRLPNASLSNFSLSDVVGVSRKLMEIKDRKTTCLAIGSKPHALAMGLAALANKKIEVTCRVPASYNGNDIPAAGSVHRFEIRDRFNPASYRMNA